MADTDFTLQSSDGREFTVGLEARVGTDPACHIFLVDPRIAPFHATLWVSNGVLFVRDEKSLAGTFVNGTRIPPGEPYQLRLGDRVLVGPQTLSVVRAGPRAVSVPPPAVEATAFGPKVPAALPPAALALRLPDGREFVVGQEMRLGRASACHIRLDDPRVSSHHASLWVQNGILLVRDENSRNGTFVNDTRLAPGQPAPLRAGDRLGVGLTPIAIVTASGPAAAPAAAALPETPTSIRQTAALTPPPAAPPEVPATLILRGPDGQEYSVRGEMLIGREAFCHVILTDPKASRRHARVWAEYGTLMAQDEDSKNGTFANGVRIAPWQVTSLRPGDTLRLADTDFQVLESGAPGSKTA